MKQKRNQRGNIPNSDEWDFINSINDRDTRWLVFMNKTPNDEYGWRTVKVCLDGESRGKSNFWLSFNGDRLAKTKDLFRLLVEHKEIFEPILESLLKFDICKA